MTWLGLNTPRTWLALLAGLAWALAFPTPGITLFAWLAPGLLLLSGAGEAPRSTLRLGYLAGLVHNLVALHWLLNIPFPWGNIAAWLALSAYCALFPMFWLWLCHRRLKPVTNPETSAPESGTRSSQVRNEPFALGSAPLKLRGTTWDALRRILDRSWSRRQLWLLECAAIWVGLEFFRGWFLGGFPWNFLAASQFKSVPLTQIAAFTGVHGVSFLIVWMSLSLALGAATVLLRPQLRFAWKNEIAPALIALLFVIAWGLGQTTRPPVRSDREIKLALVQPSIPQTLIFDLDAATNRFEQMLALTHEAILKRPDALVWPEAALPAVTRDAFQRLIGVITEARLPLILGADDAEPGQSGRNKIYNAAINLAADGALWGRYRKQRLVIFGEYTPAVRYLPFLADWSPAGMGFDAGDRPETFRIEPFGANATPNICFEDNFTDLVRDQVRADTDFVLNLTNNGWFGEGAAQWQHAANAVFRAIENRVPLVRCTNNGLTCWIDEHGRLREVFRDEHGSPHGRGVAVFTVPLLPAGTQRIPTFYARNGDWFAWLCLAVTAIVYGSVLPVTRRQATA